MIEILNKEARNHAIDRLREMVEKYMPGIDPDIIIEFYCCIDGRPPLKYTDIGKKLSSNRTGAQNLIRTFRERVSINANEPEERTLSLVEVSREFYWRIFGEAQRRKRRRQKN